MSRLRAAVTACEITQSERLDPLRLSAVSAGAYLTSWQSPDEKETCGRAAAFFSLEMMRTSSCPTTNGTDYQRNTLFCLFGDLMNIFSCHCGHPRVNAVTFYYSLNTSQTKSTQTTTTTTRGAVIVSCVAAVPGADDRGRAALLQVRMRSCSTS